MVVIPPHVTSDTPHVESKSIIVHPPCVFEDTPHVKRKVLRRVKFDFDTVNAGNAKLYLSVNINVICLHLLELITL